MDVEHIPMRRAGESDEMAAATAFLLSDGDAVPREVLDPSSHLGGRLGTSAVAHQNSTVRIGDWPATSALDVNCKMQDLDNSDVTDHLGARLG